MSVVFADSFDYFALLNSQDNAHHAAVDLARRYRGRVVTSAWVLIEVADGLCAPGFRELASRLIVRVTNDPQTTVIGAEPSWFEKGLTLYSSRPDKAWSLTDCISFEIMSWLHVSEALTGDRHFEQAGFKPLL